MDFYKIIQKPSGDEDTERYRTDFYFDDNDAKGPALTCPDCGAFISMLVSLPPYHVHLETWGEDFGDLAFWSDEVLVSRRFRDEFRKSGLKGLTLFEPVEILSQKRFGKSRGKRLKPPEYFRVMPGIGAAKIDLGASGVEWKDVKRASCPRCLSNGGILKSWQRIIVDEGSWNGADVFRAYGIRGNPLASSRFYEWSKKHDFRNLVFKPASECSHDFYPWEKK